MGACVRERSNHPGITIDLRKLEHETRPLLAAGSAVAVAMLAGLSLIYHKPGGVLHQPVTSKESRHLVTDLIEIPSRYHEPFRMNPPRIKKRLLNRPPSLASIPSNDQFITPGEPPSLTMRREDLTPFERALSEKITALHDSSGFPETVSLSPDNRIPLKIELFSDSGEYTSRILISPDNKNAIQGYLRIPIAFGERCVPSDTLRAAFRALARAMNRYTNITTSVEGKLNLLSPDLRRFPLLYLPIDRTDPLSEREIGTLGKYLLSGGFVIIDNGLAEFDTGFIGTAVRKFMVSALDSATGILKDYWVEPLPGNHPLYHSFFDFTEGPPENTSKDDAIRKDGKGGYIEAYSIGRSKRLVGVYCPQGFCRSWGNAGHEAHLKMGVNMVVYALRRPREYYVVDRIRTGKSQWIPVPETHERTW